MPKHVARSLLALAVVLSVSVAWADRSAVLGVEFPGWTLVMEGEAYDDTVVTARPLAQDQGFRCRAPEVFVRRDAATLDEAAAAFARYLPDGVGEEVAAMGEAWRVAHVEGEALMFARLSVMLLAPDGVWLVVC